MRNSRFIHCYICGEKQDDTPIPMHSLGNSLFICWDCMREMLNYFKSKKYINHNGVEIEVTYKDRKRK